MKLHQTLNGVPIGAILVLVAQPAWAAVTEVRAIQLKRTPNGIELVLNTQGNNRPAVSTVSRDGVTTVDIVDTQLQLPGYPQGSFGQRGSFEQNNPAPSIASVLVNQVNAQSVRVTVKSINKEPIEQVVRQDSTSLVLSFNQVGASSELDTANQAATSITTPATPSVPAESSQETSQQPSSPGQTPNPTPAPPPPVTAPPVADVTPSESDEVDPAATPIPPLPPPSNGQQTPPTPPPGAPSQNSQQPPGVGQSPNSTPPLLPRATAPPVGDIAIATVDITPGTEDDNGRIIMRTYRLNQIRATSTGSLTRRLITKAETGGSVGSTFGVNESFDEFGEQDVNTPISIETTASTGVGRTTSISERIPYQGAKEILMAFGASGRGTVSDSTFNTDEEIPDEEITDEEIPDEEITDEEIPGDAEESGATPLQGLEVVAESRTNTVTLIGPPRLVEIATNLLKQFDVRSRQVAVNVKIIDVDLTKERNSNADLLYQSTDPPILSGFINGSFQFGIDLGRGFLLNLLGSIQDQSAKILTNPTLIVQEGSSAQVNLTQEIFSGFETTEVFVDEGGVSRGRRRPIIRPAGVIVNVTVDHIDDNGFVSLRISPEVSAPSGETFEDEDTEARLLLQRRLETGLVRLRDGQTLILTGIIQEQDRTLVNKVPILGDIPLLGRLFRNEESIKERREVVVLVTPQILNDSDQSTSGYEYRPSPETQKLLKDD